MKIPYLLIVAGVLLVLGGCAHAPQEPFAAPRILVIDVRTEQEWRAGHLDGAILIPNDRVGQETAAVAPDRKTRIYLYSRTGLLTVPAFDALKKAGYEDLINLGTVENASRVLNLPVVK
jgi:phage shock protein E